MHFRQRRRRWKFASTNWCFHWEFDLQTQWRLLHSKFLISRSFVNFSYFLIPWIFLILWIEVREKYNDEKFENHNEQNFLHSKIQIKWWRTRRSPTMIIHKAHRDGKSEQLCHHGAPSPWQPHGPSCHDPRVLSPGGSPACCHFRSPGPNASSSSLAHRGLRDRAALSLGTRRTTAGPGCAKLCQRFDPLPRPDQFPRSSPLPWPNHLPWLS